MNEVRLFETEQLTKEQIKARFETVPEMPYKKIFDNKKLVDTAGFVPLDVRIKKFLLAGEQYNLQAEMFDSDDWRYMFDHINDTGLEVGDDIEDVNMKMKIVMQRQQELLLKKGLIKPKEADTPDRASDVKSEAKNKASDESVTASQQKASE